MTALAGFSSVVRRSAKADIASEVTMHRRPVVLAFALCDILMPKAASAECSYFLYSLDNRPTVPPSDAAGMAYSQAFLCGDLRLTGEVSVETTETVTEVHSAA